jgi:chromosome segregation ATPase
MKELDQNRDIVVTRLEDIKDDMQVVKSDVDVIKIQLSSVEREVRLLDSSMDNTHHQLKDLGDRVDGFVRYLHQHRANALRDTRAIRTEFELFQTEVTKQIESWSARFERNNNIIDKKFVRLDTELERVVSRLVPFGHVFGPLLSSFSHQVHALLKSLCKKTTKNIT